MKYWDKAWSLVDQCSWVSDACTNCWLRNIDKRFGKVWDGHVAPIEKNLNIPMKIKKPTTFAVWSDLMHESIPADFIKDAFNIMSSCQQHTFFVLTKRPERLYPVLYGQEGNFYLGAGDYIPNVWLGTTVEDQEKADERIPELLKCKPFNLFLSVEPMLEKIDILKYILYNKKYESTNEREYYLRSSKNGVIRDNARWDDMEDSGIERQSVEQSSNAAQGDTPQSGTRPGAVFSNHVARNSLSCPSPCMATFQRRDTLQYDNQSFKRQEKRQLDRKSGDCNAFGKHKTCSQDRIDRPNWRKEPQQQNYKQPNRGDKKNLCGRDNETKTTCSNVWDNFSDNFKNSERRKQEEAKRDSGKLYPPSAKNSEASQQQRAISACIIGCESGAGARETYLDWVKDLRDQCKAAGVPLFVKQLQINGKFTSDINKFPEDLRIRDLMWGKKI